MNAIRLYVDEDSLERAFVRGIRARGLDVLTAADAGMMRRESASLSAEDMRDREEFLNSWT